MIEACIKRLKDADEKVYTSSPALESDIAFVEKLFDVELPDEFRIYLKMFGSLSFGSVEIYGIIDEEDRLLAVNGNMIGLTKEAQENYGLFGGFLIIAATGMGDSYVLCCNRSLSIYGSVFYWNPGMSSVDELEFCQRSFLDFLSDNVNRVLSL